MTEPRLVTTKVLRKGDLPGLAMFSLDWSESVAPEIPAHHRPMVLAICEGTYMGESWAPGWIYKTICEGIGQHEEPLTVEAELIEDIHEPGQFK